MRDRLRGVEVLENFGIPRKEEEEEALSEQSAFPRLFRKLLFSRIVPCVKEIDPWTSASRRPVSTWPSSTSASPTWTCC